MSIYNVNTLQNKIDLLNTSDKYTDEYILQSLANIGQRLSVKGDSLTTNFFRFSDLFISGVSYDSKKYIGCISKQNNILSFKILDRTNFNVQETVSVNYNSNISNETLIEIVPEVTGITSYDNVTIKSSSITHFVKLAEKNNDDYVGVFIGNFNKYTNILTEAFRIVPYGQTKTLLYHIIYDEIYNEYKLNIYISNNILSNEYVNYITNDINSNTEDNETSDIIKPVLLNYTLILSNININYNNKYITVSNSVINRVGIQSLKNDIERFNDDVHILYPFIKEYYSEKTFLENNTSFQTQLFIELYKAISGFSGKENPIYLSCNYVIEYYCNSNNINEIYSNTQDILVKLIETELHVSNIDEYYDEQALFSNTISSTRCLLFNFLVEYDNSAEIDTSNKVINRINIVKKYTLPYINKSNYWVINDSISEISAKGINAGNPNILMIYNSSSALNDFNILSGARRKDILDKVKWKYVKTYIEPTKTVNNIDNSYPTSDHLDEINCWIPDMKNLNKDLYLELYELLQYSLIISISSNNCITIANTNNKSLYDNGCITTFWTFDDVKGEFVDIKNQTNSYGDNIVPALDLMTMSNLHNYIKNQVNNIDLKKPDKYVHDWLVFNKSYITLKNQPLQNRHEIYGNIANYKAIDLYNENIQYNNDFNLIVKYSENVEGASSNNILSIPSNQQYKYIDSLNTDGTLFEINTTNKIYSYLDQNNKSNNYKEYIPNINVPLFNLKEILLQNVNTINRLNILSFNSGNNNSIGNIYNAYIGTSFTDDNKSILHIGTSNINVNVGNDTLIHKNNTNKFKKHDALNLDLDTTNINSYNTNIYGVLNTYSNINIIGNQWVNNSINVSNISKYDTITYTIDITPISKFMQVSQSINKYEPTINYLAPLQINNNVRIYSQRLEYIKAPIINIQLDYYYYYAKDMGEKVFANQEKPDLNKSRLWMPIFYNLSNLSLSNTSTLYYCKTDNGLDDLDNSSITEINGTTNLLQTCTDLYYIGDGLFLPSLLSRLNLNKWHIHLLDFIKNIEDYIEITSNKKILYYNNYPLIMLTNSRFLDGNIQYIGKEVKYTIENKIFIGDKLTITYYIDNSNGKEKLYLNIIENNVTNKISLPYKIETQYKHIEQFIIQ